MSTNALETNFVQREKAQLQSYLHMPFWSRDINGTVL